MRKSDRLFQVVNLVRVHQPITAAKLAERLGVSVRTIYRYIDDLSLSGIPIYGEAGVGYALHKDFELPPLSLNGGELEALGVAVELLSKSAGHELAQYAHSLLAKIDAALPLPRTRPTEQAVFSPFELQHPDAKRHWDQLRNAIHGRQAVRATYTSLTGTVSDRTLFPLGLFHWGGKWTVGSWCVLREDYRDFRVDLIRQLVPLPEAVQRPVQVSLAAYMARQAQAWKEATDKTVSAVPSDTGDSLHLHRSCRHESPWGS